MMTLKKLQQKRKEINLIAAQYHAQNIRVFGSVSRGDNQQHSDIDLLVSFESGASLLDQVALSQTLSDVLGLPVDVLSDRAINKYLKSQILKEAKSL